MNYIKEINAFYWRIDINPLSPSAALLWHTLMHINNRTGWKKEFTVARSVICLKSGMPLSTFKHARKELVQKGYIIATSRGRQATVYQMVSLADEITKDTRDKKDEINMEMEKKDGSKKFNDNNRMEKKQDTNVIRAAESKMADVSPIQNKHLSHPLNVPEYIKQYFEEHFYQLSYSTKMEMIYWMDDLSESHLFEALKRAVVSEKTTWTYVKGILFKWERDGLFTIGDVRRAERQFLQHPHNRHVSNEVIPDWFYQLKNERLGLV